MKGTAAALLLVLAWPSSLPAQTNAGRVVRGVKAQVVTVEVTNEGTSAPIEPVLKIAAQPPWIGNVRIVPDSSGPLPPGRTRRFAVSFDVAADAPEGALAALEFEVSDPVGERFDNPAPEVTVQVMDTRLVLSSLTLDGRTLDGPSSAERSSRKQADWDVIAGTSFSNQTTRATWLLAGAPRLPPVIRLGEDFSIGLCGGVALRNEGGEPPRPVDRFQHKTLLAASALRRFNQARSYQQSSLPPRPGEQVRLAQEAELLFRYDPARSAPPDRFVYRADARQAGEDQDRSRFAGAGDPIDPANPLNPRSNPSPDGLEFTFGTVQTEGAVGTTSVAPRSPARIFVTLAQEISYGLMPDTGTLLFHRNARTDWTAEYRPLDEGEQPPASGASPDRGGCSAPDLGGTDVSSRADPPAQAAPQLVSGPSGRAGTTAGASPDRAARPPDGADAGSGAGAPPDPSAPSIAAYIREWIAAAEPPENATEGARFRYNPWGLRIGDSAVSSIRETPGRPDDAAGRTPEEYVWSRARQLDSVNHCTLDEFVRARLASASIDACRGRYRAAPAAVRAVPDLRGRRAPDAVAELRGIGLAPRLAGGSPASAPEGEFTVEELRPAPGSQVRPGDEVVVLVHSRFEAPSMPNLAGLTLAEAESRLTALGAAARRLGGDPAPRPELAFRVQSHTPGPGEPIARGASVDLRVHSAFLAAATESPAGAAAMPNLVGLDFSTAFTKVNELGRAIFSSDRMTQLNLWARRPQIYSYDVEVPRMGTIRTQFIRLPFTIGATIDRIESQQPPPGTPFTAGMAISVSYMGKCPVLDNRPPEDIEDDRENLTMREDGSDLVCWVWGRSGLEPSSLKLNLIRNRTPRGSADGFDPPCGNTSGVWYPYDTVMTLSGASNVFLRVWGEGQFAQIRQVAPNLMPLLRDMLRANEARSAPCP